jgi:hypothetical protein
MSSAIVNAKKPILLRLAEKMWVRVPADTPPRTLKDAHVLVLGGQMGTLLRILAREMLIGKVSHG